MYHCEIGLNQVRDKVQDGEGCWIWRGVSQRDPTHLRETCRSWSAVSGSCSLRSTLRSPLQASPPPPQKRKKRKLIEFRTKLFVNPMPVLIFFSKRETWNYPLLETPIWHLWYWLAKVIVSDVSMITWFGPELPA